MMTCPSRSFIVDSDIGCLVGSAEQSFLSLEADGKLKPGKYMALTPCFRNDDEDHWHQKGFMKLELYVNDAPDTATIARTTADCYEFFKFEMRMEFGESEKGKPYVGWMNLPDGTIDLEINGVEIGSYGHRKVGDIEWVYATGLAEPRFSRAVESYRNSR